MVLAETAVPTYLDKSGRSCLTSIRLIGSVFGPYKRRRSLQTPIWRGLLPVSSRRRSIRQARFRDGGAEIIKRRRGQAEDIVIVIRINLATSDTSTPPELSLIAGTSAVIRPASP
jgi:hypothetical protein